MENDAVLISLLESALRNSLGERYQINTQALPGATLGRSKTQPDLVIWPQDEPKWPYVVEVKMTGKGFDLPLSIANQTQRLIDENQEVNPTLILATTARVGNLLRLELAEQNVAIVKSDAPANLADDISQLILKMHSTNTVS